MILTPILLSIGTLLCLVIAYNLVWQCKQEAHLQHSERELQYLKDKETDELDVLFQPKKK